MGGFVAVTIGEGRAGQYEGRATVFVILTCILAALGGALFGYDIGISGGVTSMDDFLLEFFPEVYNRKNFVSKDQDYCVYDNLKLAAFTSSLYIAGLISTFGASYTTRAWGRRPTIMISGFSFLLGAILNGTAKSLAMLLIGRIMLGVGVGFGNQAILNGAAKSLGTLLIGRIMLGFRVGFGNQAVPLYLSEVAPPKWRGGLNMLFQLATTIGIFFANLVNYGTQNLRPWGWRLSLGLAGVPALALLLGCIFLYETPNSLVERGYHDKGKEVLKKLRGTQNVEAEFEDLIDASKISSAIKHPFKNIMNHQYRPQLIMAIFLPAFQLLTGINSILFYAPVLFQSLGFGENASLYASVITGGVMVLGSLITIATVDRYGRRKLLTIGGIVMIVCQVAIAIILAKHFGGDKSLSKALSGVVITLICLFTLGFATSWGGLGWLVPSEIFPLEIRSAGQSIVVCVNLLFTFAIAQAFLSMLCQLKYGIFLFFVLWEAIMTIYVVLFLPETKDVPLEEMVYVWRKHWFWKRTLPKPIASLPK